MSMTFVTHAAIWALETSLAASVLILLVSGLRLAFRRHPGLSYFLGLLILARLLWPGGAIAPASSLSVLNWLEVSPRAAAFSPPDLIGLSEPSIPVTANDAASPEPPPLRDDATALLADRPGEVMADLSADNVPKALPGLDTPPVWALVWFLGMAARLLWVERSRRRVRQWLREAEPVREPRLLALLDECRTTFGIAQSIALRATPRLEVPALTGWWRPVILLPARLLAETPLETLRLILLHELAHVRRRHVLVNWFSILAQSIHWFNPLVWLALRRLRFDQELLCDHDACARLAGDQRRAYGETLLALASPPRANPGILVPMSAQFEQLKERIVMLNQFRSTARKWRVPLTALAMLLGVITFTRAVPDQPNQPAAAQNGEPLFYTAVEAEPDAATAAPAAQPAVLPKQLKPYVAPAPVATTSTNALPPGFISRKDRFMRLHAQMDILRDQVRMRQADLAQLREGLGLRETPGGGEPVSKSSERVAELTRSRARWAAEYEEVNQTLAQFKQQSPAQLRQTIPIARPDPQLDKLLNDLSQQEQRLVTLRADHGPEHPDVRRQLTSFAQLHKQIDARIEGLMLGWETLANSRRELMEKIELQLQEAQDRENRDRRNFSVYFNAKRELETMERVRDSLYERYLQEKLELDLAGQ